MTAREERPEKCCAIDRFFQRGSRGKSPAGYWMAGGHAAGGLSQSSGGG